MDNLMAGEADAWVSLACLIHDGFDMHMENIEGSSGKRHTGEPC
jgi:hypothetical protein